MYSKLRDIEVPSKEAIGCDRSRAAAHAHLEAKPGYSRKPCMSDRVTHHGQPQLLTSAAARPLLTCGDRSVVQGWRTSWGLQKAHTGRATGLAAPFTPPPYLVGLLPLSSTVSWVVSIRRRMKSGGGKQCLYNVLTQICGMHMLAKLLDLVSKHCE